MSTATKMFSHKRYTLPTSSTNIYQQSFYYRTVHDWNALPPRLFDSDNIDKFTDEIQIYKS